MFQFTYSDLSYEESKRKAWPALLKARELGPELAEVHASIGSLLTDEAYLADTQGELEKNFIEAEKSFKKALSLSGETFSTLHWYGRMFHGKGEYSEAHKYFIKSRSVKSVLTCTV